LSLLNALNRVHSLYRVQLGQKFHAFVVFTI
jgi:hypothetical protein